MYINSKIAKSTLQKTLLKHFFLKMFGYIKKKYYLCNVIQKRFSNLV